MPPVPPRRGLYLASTRVGLALKTRFDLQDAELTPQGWRKSHLEPDRKLPFRGDTVRRGLSQPTHIRLVLIIGPPVSQVGLKGVPTARVIGFSWGQVAGLVLGKSRQESQPGHPFGILLVSGLL